MNAIGCSPEKYKLLLNVLRRRATVEFSPAFQRRESKKTFAPRQRRLSSVVADATKNN